MLVKLRKPLLQRLWPYDCLLLVLARVVIGCNLYYLNWVFLLVLDDVINDLCIYMDMCPKKKNVNGVCEKMKKMMAKNEHSAQKGAQLKFAHINICIFLSN